MRRFVKLADRSVLRVSGNNSTKFLQGLCTQDVSVLSTQNAAPAAFLSPKGRVLCDTLLVATEGGGSEFLIDCHKDVAKSLVRLLVRHRLREPLQIEDVSSSHVAVAQLPSEAQANVTEQQSEEAPPGFFADPRFAALGRRAILAADAATALLESGQTAQLEDYHFWRVCCAVPEGPEDIPVDSALPLHVNLDLLNFVSWTKGCYVGQELTARTHYRGAVRRRIITIMPLANNTENFVPDFDLPASAPLTLASLTSLSGGAALPGIGAGSGDKGREKCEVYAQKAGSDEFKSVGSLHSAFDRVSLSTVRVKESLNEAEDFQKALFPDGTRLVAALESCSADKGVPLAFRPPPYAFLNH